MNEYEAERAANIAANKARMVALGLGSRPIGGGAGAGGTPSGGGGAGLEDEGERAPKLRRSKATAGAGAASTTAPTRSSRRARGHDAEVYTSTDLDRDRAGGGDGDGDGDGGIATRKNGTLKKEFPDPAKFLGPGVKAPFSLRSIGVTVLHAGAIHRGAFAARYWSSRGQGRADASRHLIGHHLTGETGVRNACR